jgi:hypothetical protein
MPGRDGEAMSDFRAIGAVSATLQTLLRDRMELPDGIPSVRVTVGSPVYSTKDVDPHSEEPRVALFLYRVTENGYLQNQELPGQGSRGAFGHPPLSLNLHYLLTAYGNTDVAAGGPEKIFDETAAQYLLGSAMRVLHDIPVVTDQLSTVRVPSGRPVLHESLVDACEQVKLSLEPLTLEDISKIWTALALRYRLSVPYVVTVVQIESQRPRRFPRPVGQPLSATVPPLPADPPHAGPAIHVLTLNPPTVTGLAVRRAGEVAELPFPYARVGDTLVLRGTALAGPVTEMAFGDLWVGATVARGDRVEAVIPDATAPGGEAIPPDQRLQPGVRTARAVVGNPLTPQGSFASNDVAFMLVPALNPALMAYAVGPPRALTIEGNRLATPTPGGEVVIGRAVVPHTAWIERTPARIRVPIPDTLPARDVPIAISGPLADPVPLGNGARKLDVTIGAVTKTITANLAGATVPRDAVAGILAGLIHDAADGQTGFAAETFRRTRVELWGNRLVVVPGGLAGPLKLAKNGGSSLAGDLGFLAPPPVGAAWAMISGALSAPVALSSPSPRLTVTIGARPAITVTLPPAASLGSLDSLATALQAGITAGPDAAYAGARVGVSGAQILVIPGTAETVVFGPAPGDDLTVAELQLHGRFGVRVRANGAESVDDIAIELPQ